MKTCWQNLAVVIATFRRNDGLRRVLTSVVGQSAPPALILVVDNSPDAEARGLAETFAGTCDVEIGYLALRRNTGPAGAFAAAVDHLKASRPDIAWMMCCDDDYALDREDIIENIHRFMQATARSEPACLGIAGGFYDAGSGFMRRVRSEDLLTSDSVDVDIIPGLGRPTYSLDLLRRLDVNFDGSLFFGLEEAEIGLRLRRAGCRLLVDARRAYELRQRMGQVEEHASGGVAGRRYAVWRAYFSYRNRIIVAMRYGSARAVANLMARTLARIGMLLVVRRDVAEARAMYYALLDSVFFTERAKRRYVPDTNRAERIVTGRWSAPKPLPPTAEE